MTCTSQRLVKGSFPTIMIAPHKEAPIITIPKMVPPREAPCIKGSSRRRDMAVSRPWSMCDLCRVRARLWDKPFLSQEMANLPKLLGEGSLEAQWATLTPYLIAQVCDSKRVVDELSKIIDVLRAKVQKHKEVSHMAMANVKAVVSEMAQ
ncbi:hypothetical protein BHE74_00001927 [Ensete ventricosum]|nr:hypothetical protein GW17_00062055 [Ensete ventricosum]RWW89096.1 hypothetical protein BHE74_00001927 [Ensete ventricosum]